MTPASFQEQLQAILQDCPYRQHSPECHKFHTAMHEARTAITRLIIESLPNRLPTDNISNEANLLGVAHNRVLDTITAVIKGKQTV